MSWKKVKLCSVAKIGAGQSAPKDSDFSVNDGLPFIRAGHLEQLIANDNIVALPTINEEKSSKNKLKVLKKGSILFAKSGMSAMMNRAYLIEQDVYYVSHLASVTPNNSVLDSRFCYYFLKHFKTSKLIKDSSYPSIGLPDIENLEIPLPTLPIQMRIAEILDAADALHRKDQMLLRKYDELAQAIFIDMFGDPVKNEKGWKVKRLEEVIIFPSGLVDPRLNEYKDMYHVGGDNIDSRTGRIFGLKQAKELGLISGKFYFTSNHILYNKIRPYLNKVALPDFNGICSADMYPLLPKENEVLKEYLYFILRSPFFLDFADKQSRRANIPKINMTEMSLFELPVPPIDIQVKFISKLGGLNKNIDSVSACSDLSTNLFDSLLQQAFKGELVK